MSDSKSQKRKRNGHIVEENQDYALNGSIHSHQNDHADDDFQRSFVSQKSIDTTITDYEILMPFEASQKFLVPPAKEKEAKVKVVKEVIINKRMTDQDRLIEFKFSKTEEFSPCVKLGFKASDKTSLLLSDDAIILFDKDDQNLKMVSTQGQTLRKEDFCAYSSQQKLYQYEAKDVIVRKPMKDILNSENDEVKLELIACSLDKKGLLLCTSDGQIIIIQSHDFREISRIVYENKSSIVDIAVTDKLLAVAYADKTVILYEKKDQETEYSIVDKKEVFKRNVIGVVLCTESQEDLVVILEKNKNYVAQPDEKQPKNDKGHQEVEEIPSYSGRDNLILININQSKLKRVGSTFIRIEEEESSSFKKLFQITPDYIIMRTENMRSFTMISLDKFEVFSKGPERISDKSIRLLQVLGDDRTIMLHDQENVYLYDFQGIEIPSSATLSDKAYCYLITSKKIGDKTSAFQVISLPEKVTLFTYTEHEENIREFSIQPQIFNDHQNCLYFPEKNCTYFIETSENKPKFKNVQFATQNQKYIILCDKEAKVTQIFEAKTRLLKKEFQNLIPLTCTGDFVYCSDFKDDQTVVMDLKDFSIKVIIKKLFNEAQVTNNNDRLYCRGIKGENDINDYEEKTLYQLLLAYYLDSNNEIDNLAASEHVDEISKSAVVNQPDLNEKYKISSKTFKEVFTFQISNFDQYIKDDSDLKEQQKHGWLILQTENKIHRINISRYGVMANDLSMDHDQGFGCKISFDPNDQFFACGGKDSQNINVYSIKTLGLVQKIQTHTAYDIQCYFVDGSRALSFGHGQKNTEMELICWDTSNMESWTKIFSVEKDVTPITGSKGLLSALILDGFTCFWSEKLAHELSDNIEALNPVELRMEWISGPLGKFFKLMVEHFNKSGSAVKPKLLPYLLYNVIHPYGYTFLSWLAYIDQTDLIQTAITCKDLKYIRDRYGNSPLLYALKRNSSTKVGWICEYMSAYPKLVAEVTNVELCLLFKIGPQKLVSFIEGACIQITDGLEVVGLKKDEQQQTYCQIEPMKVRYKEVNKVLLNPNVDESEKRSIEFKKTVIALNMKCGSYESIAFQEALQECPDDKVFNTEFIQAVVNYKWRQIAFQVNFLLMMQISFTFCVTTHAYLQGNRIMLHVLSAYTVYFACIEGLMFYLCEYNSRYVSPGNVVIVCFLSFYLYNIYQQVDQFVDSMLPLINLLCWIQMIIQLQQVEIIRTFVKVFTKTLSSLTGFLIFLFLNMIAFSTTSNLLEKKNKRIEIFKLENGEKEEYLGDFAYEWFNKNKLITSLDDDINQIGNQMFYTYLTMTKGDFSGEKDPAYIIFVILITVIANIILLNLIIAIMSDAYAEVMASITEKGLQEQSAMILQQEKLMFWKRSTGNKKCLIWINYLDVLEGGWKSQVEAITNAVKSTFKNVLVEFEKTEKKLLKRLEDQIEKVSNGLNEKLDKQQKKVISQLDTHQTDIEILESNIKIKMEEHNNEILTIVENNIVEQKKQLDEINNHIEKKMEEENNLTNQIKRSLTQKLVDENAEVKKNMIDGMTSQAQSLMTVKESLTSKLENSIKNVTNIKGELKGKLETQKADINSHVKSGLDKAKEGLSIMKGLFGKKLETQAQQAEKVNKNLAKEITGQQNKLKSAFEEKLKKQVTTLISMKSLLHKNLEQQKNEIKSSINDQQDGDQKELADFETFLQKSIESEQVKDELNEQLGKKMNEVETILIGRIDEQQKDLSDTKSELIHEISKQQSEVKQFLSDKIESQLGSIKDDLDQQMKNHNDQLAEIKTVLTGKIGQEQDELEGQINSIKQQVTNMEIQQKQIADKVSQLLEAIKKIKK